MSAQHAEATVTANFGTDEPLLVHLFCGCLGKDAKTARCGKTKERWENTDVDADCLVCVDLASRPCPLCGKKTR